MAKNLIKLAASIIVLGLAAVGVALFLIDPNNYKTLIQEKAQQSIGVHIEIEGDIAWSLLPIGFDLNGLSIFDRQGKLFTRIDSMQLAVDTFSLLTLKPRIEGVYASGAKIVLSKDKQGNNNWDNMPQQMIRSHRLYLERTPKRQHHLRILEVQSRCLYPLNIFTSEILP